MCKSLDMSTQLHENLVQPHMPSAKLHKKWRLLFTALFFSRTLLSVAKKAVKHQINGKTSRTLSYTAINVEPENGYSVIDEKSLSKLIEEEDLDLLTTFGGVDGISAALKTDVNNGIEGSDSDINERQLSFGTNTYDIPPAKSIIHFLLKGFKDPVIILVIICGAISLGFGIKKHGLKEGLVDGGSIFLAVSVFVIASSVSNLWPNNQFTKLSQMNCSIKVDVFRNGCRKPIPVSHIVVGDIVCLGVGDKILADGLFLRGSRLSVNKPSLQEQSDLQEVNNLKPFLHSGSIVADGYAQMLVTSVGMNTKLGNMVKVKCKNLKETTPLQAKLHGITTITRNIGLVVALLLFVVWSVQYFIGKKPKGYVQGKTKFYDVVCEMVRILAAVVAIAAGAVAEGLPPIVVITLSHSMKSLKKHQVIVRKPPAFEAIASTNTIFVKLNQMTVTKFWLGQGLIETCALQGSPSIVELIHQAVGLHTTQPPSKVSSFIWTPTEKAVIRWAIQEMGMNSEELQENYSILHAEEFDSVKACSGFLMQKKKDNTLHVYWKGTPEAILVRCSQYYDTTGIVKNISYDTKEKLKQVAQTMATDGLQCIAFAHKKTCRHVCEDGLSHQVLEENCLTLIGFAGVKDLCRPGVRKAIEDFQNAGVNIKMVTTDDVSIAEAIATDCGVLKPNHSTGAVVEGAEFQNCTPKERMEKVENICVMARASPLDFQLMVQCLKQKGHTVAVIGNDTVDAAALREADTGISLGIQATNAAKESSDIVILNDDFVSVVNVLKWGRTMFNHIQTFVQFQITVSITSVVTDFVTAISAREPVTIKTSAAISSGEIPFATLQVLWVKLIIGTLAALALTRERSPKKLMMSPVGRKSLITNIMWRNISAQSVYHIAILLTIQLKGKAIFSVNDKVKDTMMFNTFVLCQIFNKVNARELKEKNIFKKIHRNKLLLGIIGAIIILQVVMVEFLKNFADTERLSLVQWVVTIGIAAMSWPIAWYVKWIPVPDKSFSNYLKWKN